jgi:RND superfamily putative drug exporter
LSVFVLNLTTMLGLGMGIDYSLLIITRFRRELGRGLPPPEAAVVAVETAGMAVLVSGMTVAVGLASLLISPIVETRSVAIGGLIVVAVTVALAITLLPALLTILGREVDRPYWLARRLARRGGSPAAWTPWAEHMRQRPRRMLLIGTLIMGVMAVPVLWIHTGLPARDWWPLATEAGQGVATLERMGAGSLIAPIRVLVEVPPGQVVTSPRRLRGLRVLSDSLHADPRVGHVRSVLDLRPGMSFLEYVLLYSDLPRARAERAAFLNAYLSVDGRVAVLDVLLADTSSLTSSLAVAQRARRLAGAKARGLEDASIMVGGYPAEVLDISAVVAQRFPYLIVVVLVLTGVMLGVAFQSVLVPIKAILMNTLSIAATFGLIVLVFQFGVGGTLFGLSGPTSAVFFLAPVLVFPVVFGLSMDYEVFLLSAVKECFDATGDNSRATAEGLAATASTITWAALIMILVFGSFAFARTIAVQFLGFGLAVAVLLDATLIRLVIVPSFMQWAGRWNWWPGERTARLASGASQAP